MKDLLRRVGSLLGEFSTINAGTYASSISYFAFLSLVPVLIICISLVSATGVSQDEVITFCLSFTPSALHDLVSTLVGDAFDRSGIAFSLSTITLLWSASKGVKALRRGLNATYGMQESRGAIVVAAISMGAVIILGVLLAATIYLVFSDSLHNAVSRVAPNLAWRATLKAVMNPIAILASGVLLLDLCYAHLPSGSRRLVSQLPGAVFSSLACGVLSFGFRIYVDNFGNYTVLYGSIATVAILLFWIYLVSYILLIGGFLNRVLEGQRQGVGLFASAPKG